MKISRVNFFFFRQYRQKVNVIYNSENGTVTYQNKVTFYFDPTLSNGSASDQVTSINTVTAVSESERKKSKRDEKRDFRKK